MYFLPVELAKFVPTHQEFFADLVTDPGYVELMDRLAQHNRDFEQSMESQVSDQVRDMTRQWQLEEENAIRERDEVLLELLGPRYWD